MLFFFEYQTPFIGKTLSFLTILVGVSDIVVVVVLTALWASLCMYMAKIEEKKNEISLGGYSYIVLPVQDEECSCLHWICPKFGSLSIIGQ